MVEIYGPKSMLHYFKHIPATIDGTAMTFSVNHYRNNNANQHPTAEKAGTQDALKIKDALLGLVGKTGLQKAGGASAFVGVFTGKGSPDAIAVVLTMFYDHRDKFIARYGKMPAGTPQRKTADWLADPNLSWHDTLQAICDEFIGLDCNGFVGNWLALCDPSLKIGPNTRPIDVKAKAKAVRRHLDEIEAWDVMVWHAGIHIAAIDEPSSSSDSKFWICQSAGEGPIRHEYVLVEHKGSVFTKTGGPVPKAEVGGTFEVISLW